MSTTTDADGPSPAAVCAEHWRRIGEDERWLWVPGRRLKGAGSDLSEGCILMGDELAGYGLVVDADVRISNSKVFSPDLTGGEATTLAIDGRVFGANQHVSLEVVLTAETVKFPIQTALVVPLTTRDRGLPHHIVISSTESGLQQPSWARTDDIRAISTTRFTWTTPLGRLSDQEVEQVSRWVDRMLA